MMLRRALYYIVAFTALNYLTSAKLVAGWPKQEIWQLTICEVVVLAVLIEFLVRWQKKRKREKK